MKRFLAVVAFSFVGFGLLGCAPKTTTPVNTAAGPFDAEVRTDQAEANQAVEDATVTALRLYRERLLQHIRQEFCRPHD